MQLVESFRVSCCGKTHEFTYKYEAIEFLMKHIRRKHKSLLGKLEREGRKLARSQNGCGYYDGNDKDTGWSRAQPTFREAWRENALKAILERRPSPAKEQTP
jgi:hypothetical protein